MKKNVMMRVASALGVAVLLTTCAISGTFAKYATSTSGGGNARVAKWGFSAPTSVTINNLFKYEDGGVKADATSGKVEGLIAPGTENTVSFGFTYSNGNGTETIAAPEVDYTFQVTATGTCDDSIKDNTNIKWYLDGSLATATGKTEGSWDALIAAIEALDGNVAADGSNPANKYEAGNLPTAFYNGHANGEHTVGWKWLFDENNPTGTTNNDSGDTTMGNATTLDDVSLTITITATQLT